MPIKQQPALSGGSEASVGSKAPKWQWTFSHSCCGPRGKRRPLSQLAQLPHRAQLSPKHFLMSPQQPVGEKAHIPSCAGSTALERTPGTAATMLRLVTTLAGRCTQVGCDGEDVLQGTPRALRLLWIVRDDISSMRGGGSTGMKNQRPPSGGGAGPGSLVSRPAWGKRLGLFAVVSPLQGSDDPPGPGEHVKVCGRKQPISDKVGWANEGLQQAGLKVPPRLRRSLSGRIW